MGLGVYGKIQDGLSQYITKWWALEGGGGKIEVAASNKNVPKKTGGSIKIRDRESR